VALCAVSGMLNGVFGSGKDLHVAAWQAVKVIDRSEEVEEDGTIVQRERERFTNELTLVFASGETAILRAGKIGRRTSRWLQIPPAARASQSTCFR
jgi:hypothetical protein